MIIFKHALHVRLTYVTFNKSLSVQTCASIVLLCGVLHTQHVCSMLQLRMCSCPHATSVEGDEQAALPTAVELQWALLQRQQQQLITRKHWPEVLMLANGLLLLLLLPFCKSPIIFTVAAAAAAGCVVVGAAAQPSHGVIVM